jgi:branched-chain amino acid transport system permease protein
LRALQGSEIAAATAGIDVARLKAAVFVLSAAMASFAGSLFAHSERFVTPTEAGFLRSIEFVTMAVIGGLGSILGSIVGAAVLVILPQMLTVFHEYETLVLGVMIVLFMIFMREGIVPGLASRLGTRRA